jgi:hypothetical protein
MVSGTPTSGTGSLGDPTKAWYVRENKQDSLDGPMTFQHAELVARKLSRENNSGLAEVVVYEGSKLFVVGVFLRGAKRFQGRRAQTSSDFDLPPTV